MSPLDGLIRIPAPDGRRIDVAIVQGNDHEVPLADPRLEDLTIAQNHARLHRELASDPPDLAVWPGDPRFDMRPVSTVEADGVAVSEIHMSSHAGTHVDAPAHFRCDGSCTVAPREAAFRLHSLGLKGGAPSQGATHGPHRPVAAFRPLGSPRRDSGERSASKKASEFRNRDTVTTPLKQVETHC